MAKKKCQTMIQNEMKSNMSMEGFKSISIQRIKVLTGPVKRFFPQLPVRINIMLHGNS